MTNTGKQGPDGSTNVQNSAAETAEMSLSLQTLQDRYTGYIRLLLDRSNMNDVRFDLSPLYPDTADIEELKAQVGDLKRCLDSLRPIPTEQAENLQESFDTKYTYDSNRIEGNTLTLQETAMVTLHGATIGGKPLKDHLEAINHRDALKRVREMVEVGEDFTERSLLDIHSIILSGNDRDNAGRYRTIRIRVGGTDHVFPNPMKVPELVTSLFADYEAAKGTEHPVTLAARMHAGLVNIHPFVDGNGRTARLWMNHLLLASGYVIANISGDKSQRGEYYAALEATHSDDSMADFIRFILRTEKASLMEYLAMLDPDVSAGRGGYFLERIAPYLP
jgi:Fic family protein